MCVFVIGYGQEHHLFVVLGVHALVCLCVCVLLAVCAPDFGLMTQANMEAVMLAHSPHSQCNTRIC